MTMTVRPLAAKEWRTFRDLRVQALRESPDAFFGTSEEIVDLTDDEWIEIVESTALHPQGELLVLEVDGTPLGTAFVSIREEGAIGTIGAMWVDLPHDGTAGPGTPRRGHRVVARQTGATSAALRHPRERAGRAPLSLGRIQAGRRH